jgi:hypothetical protein
MMIDSDQIFNPRLWFVILGLLTVAFPIYVFVLWKSWKLAVTYLIGFLCFGVYLAFYSARNFGGAFGAGMVVGCLSALLVPISLVLWLLLRRPFRQKFAEDIGRLKMYFFGSLIIILTQLLPFVGSYAINFACFSFTQHNAAPLINAIEQYRQQIGVYPAEFEDLAPTYLQMVPTPACGWLSGQDYRSQVGFELIACPNGDFLLTNLSMDGVAIERYQFSSHDWSSISFFDGACSHLP